MQQNFRRIHVRTANTVATLATAFMFVAAARASRDVIAPNITARSHDNVMETSHNISQVPTASRTTVVMLGTGTPIPDPERFGPSVVIIVDSVAYLFDAGSGVVRRAAAVANRDNMSQLSAPRLSHLFLTHLHSDHTMGVNDVMLTPWVQGRTVPLEVYGPPGTRKLITALTDAYRDDIEERLATSGGPSAEGWKTNVHEVAEGEVYRDARIKVRAFEVPHSGWKHAFGYRITTPDRTIVLSGDARPNDIVARECNGCDILIHEVYSNSGFASLPAARQAYHAQAHTSATQLGATATVAHPGMLVLYHQLYFGATDATLLAEVRSAYRGAVVSAKDLARF